MISGSLLNDESHESHDHIFEYNTYASSRPSGRGDGCMIYMVKINSSSLTERKFEMIADSVLIAG